MGRDALPLMGKAAERLGILLTVSLAAVPLLIAPGVSFYFDITPKVVVLLLGAGVGVLLWDGYGPGLRTVMTNPWGRGFVALIGAQALSLLVSTAFSLQIPLSFAGTNWRRLGLVTHIGLLVFALVALGWLVAHRARWIGLLRAVTLAGGAAAAYGVLQYAGIDPLLPAEAYQAPIGGGSIVRPPGPLGHAGYFGTYLLYAIFLAGAQARLDSSRVWRAAGLSSAALSVAAVLLSGTRSALLGLAAGGLLLLLWYRPRVTRRAAAAGVICAVLFATFVLSPAGQMLRNRVVWVADDLSGGGRLWLWQGALRMTLDYWAAGAGPETFSNAYPRYQPVELARAYPNFYHESPHNIFLDAATAQGAPGLAVALLLAGLPLVAAWRLRSKKSATGFLAASFAAGLVSQQFLVFTAPTALYFYFVAALVVASVVPDEASVAERASPLFDQVGRVAVSLVLLVFAAQLTLADLGLEQTREYVRARQVIKALDSYTRARRVEPWGMNADVWFADCLDLLAKTAPDIPGRIVAVEARFSFAERASRRSELRAQAYYRLSTWYASAGDHKRAREALSAAIEIAPRWYKPRWLLAHVLTEQGLSDQGLREAELAVWLNGHHDSEVTATLEALRD